MSQQMAALAESRGIVVDGVRDEQTRVILEGRINSGVRNASRLIEQIHTDAPLDQISPTKRLVFEARPRALSVGVGDNQLAPSEFALGQIAERAKVPTSYLKGLVSSESPSDNARAAYILQDTFANSVQERVLVRSVRGQLRGFLSDRYRRLDSRPLVDALAAEAAELGAVPFDGTATETRVALKVILPRVIEPVAGEAMVLGVEWSNSDFGNGTHSIRAFALRVVCLNGMTRENVMKQIHLGGRLGDDIRFSEQTHQLDTRASASALRDVVRGQLSAEGIERVSASIRAAAEKSMSVGQLQAAVRNDATKDQAKKIVEAFESLDVVNLPAGNTLWRASNAISWIARHVESDESRLDLERLAGKLV
jgi:hypothetical protein